MAFLTTYGGIQIALWTWAEKKLRQACWIGLAVFVALQVTNTCIDPSSVTRGLPLKLLFLFVFGRGLMLTGAMNRLAARARAPAGAA